jgi:hypothetical protein
MTNESTHLYKVYVDNSTKCPTLRIEWIQTTDMLPTFINSLPGWQKRKIYDYIRDYCIAVDTSDNKIHHFYYQYNNDDGINYLKTLL